MPAFAKNRTLEQDHVAKKTPLVFAWSLALLLLAVVNPLLSTARADGGVAATVPVLLTTFTNPTPAAVDLFGNSVAAVGNDRVLIGASQDDTGANGAGAAYLFSANGTLLTTFTNPAPAAFDLFGISVAAVGSDRVLIGARLDDTGVTDAGAAYLFSTNGTLLTTFTNPTPTANDAFGFSVAAVGSDHVLIGAHGDDNAGAAYLFSANGTLLTTFTNPTPTFGDSFGNSVAAVGSDRVLIGARLASTGATNAGTAYLFSTNGTLLTTFTNPTPAANDAFGFSVAAVGSDHVLIGAESDDTGATNAGAAYLFSINGTLVTTFTNPTPGDFDRFGNSVAAVGSDRVLIGARADSTGATNAGAAYLFSTNGTLLTTFTNPTPTANDAFGFSVAAMGSDRILVGANFATASAGAAYLFKLVPSLDIRSTTTNTLAVSWPLLSPDFTLQQNTNGIATVNWSNVTETVQDDGTNKFIIVDPATGNRFYRLSKT